MHLQNAQIKHGVLEILDCANCGFSLSANTHCIYCIENNVSRNHLWGGHDSQKIIHSFLNVFIHTFIPVGLRQCNRGNVHTVVFRQTGVIKVVN